MNAIRTTYPLLGFWDTRQGGRAENQDSCGFIDTPYGLIAVVCDGMGGGPAGKEASTLAVQAIAEYFCNQQPDTDDLKVMMQNAIEHAHQAIISKCESHPEMRGMGSTVVAALFNSKAAIVAHIGDSRLYQLRRGEKVFRTEDHSMVADMVRSKELTEEQARLSLQTNVITKALGGKNGTLADIDVLPYEKGDRFLLCTDGIWNALPEGDLVKRAAKTPSLAGAVDSVVLMADEIGRKNGNNHDNLTLALFETKEDSTTKVKMNRKAINIIRALTVLCCISFLACIFMAVKLMKPSAEKIQLEQIKKTVEQKTDSIKSLTGKKDSLEKQLDEYKNKAEKAEEENRKMKVLNLTTQEPIQDKKEIVDKTKEQAKEEKDTSNHFSKEIDDLIKSLNVVANKNSGSERNKQIESVIKEVTTLSSKDKSNLSVYNHIKNKLKDKSINNKDINYIIDPLIKELNKIK